MLRSEPSSRMSIAAVWKLLPRRPCYNKLTAMTVTAESVPPGLGLATFCILAESFGRLKESRHNKTVTVSIDQSKSWPRVIPSGKTAQSERRWSQPRALVGLPEPHRSDSLTIILHPIHYCTIYTFQLPTTYTTTIPDMQ